MKRKENLLRKQNNSSPVGPGWSGQGMISAESAIISSLLLFRLAQPVGNYPT